MKLFQVNDRNTIKIFNQLPLKFILDEDDFRHIFYRVIDTETADDDKDSKDLLEIEFATFKVIKAKLEEEMGSFDGSLSQNRRGDEMVANVIRGSLHQYEKNRKSYDKQYFSF